MFSQFFRGIIPHAHKTLIPKAPISRYISLSKYLESKVTTTASVARTKLELTKSNWNIDEEKGKISGDVRKLTDAELKTLAQYPGIADMSWGALSLQATMTMHAGMNLLREFVTEELEERSIVTDVRLRSGSGEGGVHPDLAGSVYAATSGQLSGGANVSTNFIEPLKEFTIKGGQTAKVSWAGLVSLLKLLADPDLAKARGVIPAHVDKKMLDLYVNYVKKELETNPEIPKDIKATNAVNYSIEELTAIFKFVIRINPDIESIALKVPSDPSLGNSIAALVKTMVTAEVEEGKPLEKWLFASLEAGGTGSTHYHKEGFGESNVSALLHLHHELMLTSGTNVGIVVDGSVFNSSQIAKILLINKLFQDEEGKSIPIRINMGTGAMWATGCVMLDACHIPGGCTKGVASSSVKDLKRFDGTPSAVASHYVLLAKAVNKRLTSSLPNFETASVDEVKTTFEEIPIPIEDIEVYPAVPLPKPSEQVEIPGLTLDQDIKRYFQETNDSYLIQDEELPEYLGSRHSKLLSGNGYQLTISRPKNVPIGLGTYLPKQGTIKIDRDVDQGALRWGAGKLVVDGHAGYGLAEAAKWSAKATTLSTGLDTAKVAQGVTISTCQLGSKAFEVAKSGQCFIWGSHEHYTKSLTHANSFLPEYKSFQVNNSRFIGRDFANDAVSIRLFFPKKLDHEVPEKIVRKELSKKDIETIWHELNDYVANISKASHIGELRDHLLTLSDSERDSFIKDNFSKGVMGVHFQEWEENILQNSFADACTDA